MVLVNLNLQEMQIFLFRFLFLVNRKPSEKDTSATNKFNAPTISII